MSEPLLSARDKGLAAEEAACAYLRSQGYEVLERNYLCRYGEIDIVAREGETLVFVEVRYRGVRSRESPGESLTPKKVMRIRKAVKDYVFVRRISLSVPVRVDACLVSPDAPPAKTRRPKGSEQAGAEAPCHARVPGLGFVRFDVIRGAVDFV